MSPRSKRIKKTSVEEPRKISENLRKIYENSDGSMPDMKRFDHSRRGFLRRFMGMTLVLLGVGSLIFGVWIFLSPRLAYEDQVSVSIEGTQMSTPGGNVSYTIRYKNPDTVAIANATLYLKYPAGFVVSTSTSQVLAQGSRIDLGSIAPQSSGTVLLDGRLFVDEHSTSTLSVVLSYKPANFNSVFEKTARFDTVAAKPAVLVEWIGSGSALSETAVSLSFLVKPIIPISGQVVVTIEPDSGFTLQGSEPKSDENTALQWTIPELKQVAPFRIDGIFSGENATSTFRVRVSGKSFIYAKSEISFSLSDKPIQVAVIALGSSERGAVRPGETIPLRVSFANSGTETYSNLSAVLYVDSSSYEKKSILDWQNMTDTASGFVVGQQVSDDVRRAIISWNESQRGELAHFTPGTETAFEIAVPVKDGSKTSLVNFSTSTVTVWGQLSRDGEVIAESNRVLITILSDLNVSASAAVSGSERRFSVALTNSFHDLRDVSVKTSLNGDISWNQNALSVPAGSVVFSSGSNEMIWTIKELPSSVDSLNLTFGVTALGSNSAETDFTGPINVSATDAETGERIAFTVPPVRGE